MVLIVRDDLERVWIRGAFKMNSLADEVALEPLLASVL